VIVRLWIAWLAAGCGGAPLGLHAAAADDDALAIADHRRVHVVRIAPTGLVITRTALAPHEVVALAWAGGEPVVMLRDGTVGHIARSGYVPFPDVPDAMWTAPRPSRTAVHFDAPRFQVIVDAAGAVWRGRCEWGGPDDCTRWLYARVSGPLAITELEPKTLGEPALPVIEAPAVPAVHVVQTDDGRTVLRCEDGGRRVDWPEDDRGPAPIDDIGDLTWVSRSPPIYRITAHFGRNTIGDHPTDEIFEGCELAYIGSRVVAGPHELVALIDDYGVTVLRHGRLIGKLPLGGNAQFAPGLSRTGR
jgi:hypothetical protein